MWYVMVFAVSGKNTLMDNNHANTVREALDVLARACATSQTNLDWPAALDLIEQRAAEMEKALRQIEKFGGKAWFDAQETARAALYAARVKLKAEA